MKQYFMLTSCTLNGQSRLWVGLGCPSHRHGSLKVQVMNLFLLLGHLHNSHTKKKLLTI